MTSFYKTIKIVVLFLSIFFIRLSCYATIDDETALQTNLLSNYSNSIRPGADRNQPVNITIKIFVLSLKGFDESTSKFSIAGALNLEWNDNRLKWDPSKNGYVYYIQMMQSQIWLPLLMIMNGYDSKMKSFGTDTLSVGVHYYGHVVWTPPAIFESTCDADVTYYPFDSQICTIKFFLPGYGVSEIKFIAKETTADMTIYEKNGLWDITNTRLYSMVSPLQFEEFRVEFYMKRRSTYYVIGLILPISLLSFLQLVVFILPAESGERVGYAITVLLAVAVFLTIIQDKLPEASEPSVSWFTYKLLVDLFIGCSLVTLVICGLRFYHADENDKIGPKLQAFTQFMLQKQGCKFKGHNMNKISEKMDEKDSVKDEGKADHYISSWKEVGLAFDRLCAVLLTVALLLNNIIYFTVMALLGSI